MIALETLQDFFRDTRRLKEEGKAKFDIDQECRWSFFMVDADRQKLTQAGRHLEQIGFEVVGFLDPSPEDQNPIIYLRFDRVGTHTPESLFELNSELYAIARKFDLADYDGMDVGAVDGP